MSLNDAMANMYLQFGTVKERWNEVYENHPEPGVMTAELGKEKDQKVFEKKKEKFRNQLERGKSALKSLDSALIGANGKIRDCTTALEKENKRIKETEELIASTEAQIDNINQTLKKVDPSEFDKYLISQGFPADVVAKKPGGEAVNKELHMRSYRDRLSDAKKAYTEFEEEIMSMNGVLSTSMEKHTKWEEYHVERKKEFDNLAYAPQDAKGRGRTASKRGGSR